MKRWRVVETKDGTEGDLTAAELVGISVLLTNACGEPQDDRNVYWRACQKIQPAVRAAKREWKK